LPNDQFDFIQIQNQQDVLAEHAQKRFEFLTQRNSISYARQHPEQFVGADDAKLAKELSDITDAINKMETEASACLRDASKCEVTKFDISDFPLPQLLSPSQHPSSITVPDVLEEDASLAQATLEALGLRCTVTIQAVPGLLPHFVGSQDPPAGSTVPAGTTVNLVVAP